MSAALAGVGGPPGPILGVRGETGAWHGLVKLDRFDYPPGEVPDVASYGIRMGS